MNSFEQFTLIIGILAVLFEAVRHLKEKIKEWLSYNELSLSEMAWRLSYSSAAHLSNQFKKITGFTPTYFKQLKDKKRIQIENI